MNYEEVTELTEAERAYVNAQLGIEEDADDENWERSYTDGPGSYTDAAGGAGESDEFDFEDTELYSGDAGEGGVFTCSCTCFGQDVNYPCSCKAQEG